MSLLIPTDIQAPLCRLLEVKLNTAVSLTSFALVSGGCINQGGRIKTSAGNFFLKWNDTRKFPGMFNAEAKGLHKLRQAGSIDVPLVIGTEECDEHQFILIEFVESKPMSKNFWTLLGENLAHLHAGSSPAYGLDHDNYIGSLPQHNTQHNSWIEFYCSMRLHPQLMIAVNSGKFDKNTVQKFETLFNSLHNLLPEEKPSLLHGDLWRGNLLVNDQGNPCIIDPAIYFGNREAELAFTKLFGGFDLSFYEAYQYESPLLQNFEEREELYHLYPLLVHVNLFGGGYTNQVKRILEKFC